MGKKAVKQFLPRPPACLEQFAEESVDVQKVEEEVKSIQSRLKEIFTQVWDENATFQRIMYKNQNQHRRTVYFRRLLQVRRDLLLLHSFGLKDVFETLPHCVSLSKQDALPRKTFLGSLGQGLKSKEQLILTVQRRLLGAARLLQLMSDPILSASSAVEGLLSQAFFMPFALTVLAMLARLRVLLMQALYDMISAFNLVSAFVQKMEIASVRADVPLFMECSWDGAKLTFCEKARPRASPAPEELIPLPTCVSDAANLPDAGWFIDDRSTLAREKLQSGGAVEPVLYDREAFILEDCQFELLGEEEVEETGIPIQAGPTLSSAISSMEANVSLGVPEMGLDLKAEMGDIQAEAAPTPSSTIPSKETGSSSGIGQSEGGLSADVKAELESWKAELESWGSKEGGKSEPHSSGLKTKKRVAYVSVEIGGSKESKIPKTGHP